MKSFLKWFNDKGRKFITYILGMQIVVIAFYTSDKFTGDNLVTAISFLTGIFCGFNVMQKFSNGGNNK